MREYVESVLRRKKSIPYKPSVRGKHIESILGTCENMTKKGFNLNNTIPHSVRLVNPFIFHMKIVRNEYAFTFQNWIWATKKLV
jgi:hypothetical protein